MLELEPNDDIFGNLRGELVVRSLDRHPRYDAISHAWGGPQASQCIYLNGARLPLTNNLHSCLRHLRHKSLTRCFWLDAICVNQYDDAERSQQVQQMEHIFRTADVVRVWVGDVVLDDVDSTFRLLKLTASGEIFEDHSDHNEHDFTQLCRITESAWFGRLWVMQEAALARVLTFHHGLHDFSWDQLYSLLGSLFVSSQYWDTVHNPGERLLGYLCRLKLWDLQGAIQLLVNTPSSPQEKATRLVRAMSSWRAQQLGDAKDRVFGIAGILTALFNVDIMIVDYKKSTQEVYAQFAFNLINTTKSLAILNQANKEYHALKDLPSWVPDWSSRYDFAAEATRLDQYNGVFSAGGAWQYSARLSIVHQDHVGYLGLSAHIVCCIETVATPFDVGIPRTDFISDPAQGRHTDQRLLQCLQNWGSVWGAHHGQLRDGIFERTCFRDLVWKSRISSGDDAADALSRAKNTIHGDRVAGGEYNNLYASVSMSRFFVTDTGLSGLGPFSAEPGDVVAIIPGGTVPYILREHSDPSFKDCYIFVGECYVHSIMDGELLRASTAPIFKNIWLA